MSRSGDFRGDDDRQTDNYFTPAHARGVNIMVIAVFQTILNAKGILLISALYTIIFSNHPVEALPEFVAHHTVEKLCLPCKLVLPQTNNGD